MTDGVACSIIALFHFNALLMLNPLCARCLTFWQGRVFSVLEQRHNRPQFHSKKSIERTPTRCDSGKWKQCGLLAAVRHVLPSVYFCNILRRYLFQSIDTSPTIDGQINPNKLSICTAELVDALKYTDVGGSLGTHPNYPPFPLCRSKTTAAAPGPTGPAAQGVAPNPAYATEGYLADQQSYARANWVTTDWTPTITVPSTLVKTTSSATM
jgi:hypothetical protein